MISQGVSVNMGASQDEDFAANPRLKGKRFMEVFEQTVQVLRAPEFFFFGEKPKPGGWWIFLGFSQVTYCMIE